ncbi:hypothetical protein [Knoellia subterranea]|uniref:Membrane protein n=1 Tax=Knoellia subterranea KCTC 19937 TaxID=1385521 RepID=A0A0A0JMQ9_9MICO|nr:hypothetical protein [Knoellia subterranea]KGN38423.1 membrane protein [Knoellia subterranea KCTC 19937]
MTWLAIWLLGVGVTDLLRAVDDSRVRRAAVPVGAVVVVGVGLLAGLTGTADLVTLIASTVPLAAWAALSERSLVRGGGHVEALLTLGVTAVVLVAASGLASPPGGVLADWLAWADLPFGEVSVDRVLLVVGFVVANLATGNVIVRLVLVSVGALRPSSRAPRALETQPSDKLRGGRLLGPMERIFILGLGLAGQITAASIVIAAKGLIRFPELQSARDDDTSIKGDGIDEVTEYFLVGSFVSWLVALGSLALTH